MKPNVRLQSGSFGEASGSMILLVHGGAWAIPDEDVDAHRVGVLSAVLHGRGLLKNGTSAIDVVTEVLAQLESNPTFDAGVGARLDRDGRAQLDAGLMDGATYTWGAVANVRRVAHPIRVARQLVDSDGQARFLVAEGAERFAVQHGIELVDNEVLVTRQEWARYERLADEARFHSSREFSGTHDEDPHGTVGCVALDCRGHLAAGTSTGGASYTLPGRVGDSPLIGSGFYASPEAAASSTGWGEAIATVQLCSRAVDAVGTGLSPEESAVRGLQTMGDIIQNPRGEPARGGLIVLDHQGVGGWAHSSPRMARGGWSAGADAWVAV